MTRAPLAISTGDPGGVGPEISLRVALAVSWEESLVLFGDAAWLADRARTIDPKAIVSAVPADGVWSLPKGAIGLSHAGVAYEAEALSHRPTARGGLAQLRALDAALAAARSGRARALVTAPMSKSAVNLAGHDFVGHTEHLARAVGLADDDVTMMFLGPRLRVALVTTHVAVCRLPSEITAARVERTIRHLAEALVRFHAAQAPQPRPLRLVVAGLNPHAGEGGLFGDEERRVIAPAMQRALTHDAFASKRVTLEGPMPAETAFRVAASGGIDGVVAMMHDQATIASKVLDFGQAVNVTWGLPFVRTSVDHGVAYDAARDGSADAQGMHSALRMAQWLSADGG